MAGSLAHAINDACMDCSINSKRGQLDAGSGRLIGFLLLLDILRSMSTEDASKYHEVAQKFKEMVDSVTKLDLRQLKLYLVGLEKKIVAKVDPFFKQYDSVKELLDNTKQAKGKVIMHYACAAGNLDVVKLLVEDWKVDTRVKDKEGNSLIFTALEHDRFDIFRYFVETLKFSVNETKSQEISCLHVAVTLDNINMIDYILSKGANIEKLSICGRPLNWAVASNKIESVKHLLAHKAHPDGDFTASSPAPLILSIDMSLKPIYDVLVKHGANVNIRDPNGYTALHVAAEKGDLEVAKDLVSRGAELAVSVNGKTPLYLAFEKEKWNVVHFLREHEPDYERIEREVTDKLKADASQSVRSVEDKNRAEELKISGNKIYAEKHYELALQEYKKALELDMDNEVIHRNIAACHLALSNFQEALTHCHFAKRKDSKNVKTIFREASAYAGLNNFVDAASSMWECSLLEPNNAYFKAEFLKHVEKARAKHQEQASKAESEHLVQLNEQQKNQKQAEANKQEEDLPKQAGLHKEDQVKKHGEAQSEN